MQQAKSSVDCSESYFTPLDPATAVNNAPTTAGTAQDEWPLKGKKATFMTVAVVVMIAICIAVSVVTVITVNQPVQGDCQSESTTCQIIMYSYGDYWRRNCSTPTRDINSANVNSCSSYYM